jgi:hypothetical protein
MDLGRPESHNLDRRRPKLDLSERQRMTLSFDPNGSSSWDTHDERATEARNINQGFATVAFRVRNALSTG